MFDTQLFRAPSTVLRARVMRIGRLRRNTKSGLGSSAFTPSLPPPPPPPPPLPPLPPPPIVALSAKSMTCCLNHLRSQLIQRLGFIEDSLSCLQIQGIFVF